MSEGTFSEGDIGSSQSELMRGDFQPVQHRRRKMNFLWIFGLMACITASPTPNKWEDLSSCAAQAQRKWSIRKSFTGGVAKRLPSVGMREEALTATLDNWIPASGGRYDSAMTLRTISCLQVSAATPGWDSRAGNGIRFAANLFFGYTFDRLKNIPCNVRGLHTEIP